MKYTEVYNLLYKEAAFNPASLLKLFSRGSKVTKPKLDISRILGVVNKKPAPLDLQKSWLFKGRYEPKFYKSLQTDINSSKDLDRVYSAIDSESNSRAYNYIDAIRNSITDKSSLLYSKTPELEKFLKDKGLFGAKSITNPGDISERLYDNMKLLSEKADELRAVKGNEGTADAISAAFKWLKGNGGI